MSKHVRRRLCVGCIVIFLALAGVGVWLVWKQPLRHYSTPVGVTAPLVVSPGKMLTPVPQPVCSHGGTFTPAWVFIQGVAKRLPVLAVPRTQAGTSGALPVTVASKQQVGWDDASRKPGSQGGNTLLTAHTWPSFDPALGNKLLAKLGTGAQIVLHGVNGQRACYQVSQIVTKPVADYPGGEVYRMDGMPSLAITVCSGKRLGPGDWSERTIWFARAVE
jgi:hypothetical protein